jgi:uncharacterized repeat protein (TIGR01451 family)
VSNVTLSIVAPAGWTVDAPKTFAGPVAPGASVSATFKVTSGPAAFSGDLIGKAAWGTRSETIAEKVRNNPIKINEFRISTSSNSTDGFVELYNAGASSVDLSGWTLTEHPTQQAIFSTIKVPAGTTLPAHGFYLLGESTSGLAVPASAGDTTIYVRATTGLTPTHTINIDGETRTISGTVGTAATANTTLWQPLPEGPIITIPVGSTSVPVSSVSGFITGTKIALGYGAIYPAVQANQEQYEIATVTAVGTVGTQAYLRADAHIGDTKIQVSNVTNIRVGDKIRLDIDSVGHGIETVTVTNVGTTASTTTLSTATNALSTTVKVASVSNMVVGNQIIIGVPGQRETVTLTRVGTSGANGTGIDFTPALALPHLSGQLVIVPGTGLTLAAPLTFNHSYNLPFSDWGTGISFTPATAFPHSSNEPVQALGTGITLDSPLSSAHPINAVVSDPLVTTAGYQWSAVPSQGSPAPNQWFGGPALNTSSAMILRDAAGLVSDSFNIGAHVDPWASEGYQALSAATSQSGCKVTAPSSSAGDGKSRGRYPGGADTGSSCTDFPTQTSGTTLSTATSIGDRSVRVASTSGFTVGQTIFVDGLPNVEQPTIASLQAGGATTLSRASAIGDTNVKVASISGLAAGQTVLIDTITNTETATIATVGTTGATTLAVTATVGVTNVKVSSVTGFSANQTITIDSGANLETAVIKTVGTAGSGGTGLTLTAALTLGHASGVQVSGSGVTLTAPLTLAHASGVSFSTNLLTFAAPLTLAHASGATVNLYVPTPGAANLYPVQVISGQVYNDLNGNGSKGATETGLAGWTVQLINADNSTVVATQKTDVNGNFSFTGISVVNYEVRLVLQSQYVQTTANPAYFPVSSTADVTNQNFGVVRPNDLQLSIVQSPGNQWAGTTMPYTITVYNNGPAVAPNATLTDTIPVSTTFVSATAPAGWTCAAPSGMLTCTNPAMAQGKAVIVMTVLVDANVANSTKITDTATFTSNVLDSKPANNSYTVSRLIFNQSDVSIQQVGDIVGSKLVQYTFTIQNAGPNTAKSVVLTDALAATTAFANATPSQGTCSTAGQKVTCALGDVAMGSTVTVVIQVNVTGQPASITNTGKLTTATVDPHPADKAATAVVTGPF